MGTCKNKKLIGPYLDGQLGDCRWLDEHISECSQCLMEYEAIQKLNHLAGKLDLAPPESHYWKNFSARTMARIATNEARTVKSRSWLFFTGYRTPLKVFSLVASIIIIIGLSFLIGENQKSQVVSTIQKPSGIESSNLIPGTSIGNATDNTQTTLIDNAISNKMLANNYADVLDSSSQVGLSGFAPTSLRDVEPDASLRGQFRYVARNRADLIEPDLPAGTGAIQSDVFEPNTDMVIVYQINQGSKAGEIPLMVYRQATVRFFGPDKAIPWRNINRLTTPNWGFAAGDRQVNEKANNRLNMELDLSQDK
jgi:hypothetical protein